MPRPLSVLCRWLLSSRLVTKLLWPLVVALPTAVLAATQIQNLSAVEQLLKPVRDVLNSHPYYALCCLIWTVVLIVLNWLISPKIEGFRRRAEALDANELVQLLQHFDDVVGHKMERFAKVARRLELNPGDKSVAKTFREITQPHEQLRLLLNKIYLMFLTDIGDQAVDLRVVLAKMDGVNVQEYEGFFPENLGPAIPVNTLRNVNNGYKTAAISKRMVVIADITKECKKQQGCRYAVSPGDPSPSGSMICFPLVVRHSSATPYVLSVKCERKNHFTEDGRKRYETLLRPFSHRILLEYSLATIKTKVS